MTFQEMMVQHITLVAMAVAVVSDWAVVRIARKMSFEGVGVEDSGGYAALLIVTVMINVAAIAVALS